MMEYSADDHFDGNNAADDDDLHLYMAPRSSTQSTSVGSVLPTPSLQPSFANHHNLLPGILSGILELKEELREAQQATFLLEKENKSLIADCNNYQFQLDQIVQQQQTDEREHLLQASSAQIHQEKSLRQEKIQVLEHCQAQLNQVTKEKAEL